MEPVFSINATPKKLTESFIKLNILVICFFQSMTYMSSNNKDHIAYYTHIYIMSSLLTHAIPPMGTRSIDKIKNASTEVEAF